MDILKSYCGNLPGEWQGGGFAFTESCYIRFSCRVGKVQSTEASNAIEGIVTTSTRLRQLVADKTTPRNRDEQEIMGYRGML